MKNIWMKKKSKSKHARVWLSKMVLAEQHFGTLFAKADRTHNKT
jgi:hypothetical protein